MESQSPTPHITVKWHQLFGKEQELVLTPVGITVLLESLTMSEPPRVDVVLLRRNASEWTPEQRALLPDGVRDSRANHNLIEYKQTESVNLSVFKWGLIYDELYLQGHDLARENLQTFILCARTPQAVTLEQAGFKMTETPGVYRSDNVFMETIILISINDLQPELHNSFVQLFASKRRIREAAFVRLLAWGRQRMNDAFWNFVTGLHEQWEDIGGEMKGKPETYEVTAEKIMESGRRIRKLWLESLTPEELARMPAEKLASLPVAMRLAGLAPEERLAGMNPEERLAGLAPEERLAGLAPEERLAGLAPEERLAGLNSDELARLHEEIERYLSQQQTPDE